MTDSPEIADDCWLLRWVPPDFGEQTATGWRPTSQAFQDIEMDGITAMSVYAECLLIALGEDERCVLSGLAGYGLVGLLAKDMRDRGFTIELRPHEGDLPRGRAHAHLMGPKPKSARRRLAADCTVRIEP